MKRARKILDRVACRCFPVTKAVGLLSGSEERLRLGDACSAGVPGENLTVSPAGSRRRGSVLVIVLVMLMFTTLALVAFIDKASTDLIVDTRDTGNRRLRQEAYSALEVTLAVLETFRQVDGQLRSVTQGWGDPLAFAGWAPTEGHTIEVAFEDETAKISLPRADQTTLINLFEAWGMPQGDAERLTDALMHWMKPDYSPGSSFLPDYDVSAIPYAPPARSLRSFNELAAIDVARDLFYDEDRRPNDLWRRFANAVSLFNYARPNLNTARPDVLSAVGNLDDAQKQQLGDYLTGANNHLTSGPAYFRSVGEAAPMVGGANMAGFDAQIRALRIKITVHEGKTVYRLTTVVAPQGGASTVRSSSTNTSGTNSSTKTPGPSGAAGSTGSANSGSPTANSGSGTTGTTSAAATKKLNYPFTVLEIRENDDSVPVTAPPPESL